MQLKQKRWSGLLYLVLAISLAANLLLVLGLAIRPELRQAFRNILKPNIQQPETDSDRPQSGKWGKARTRAQTEEGSVKTRVVEQLEAVGYLAGTRPAPDDLNVTIHDRERVSKGLNLYTAGHAPEAILMDMAGNRLHRWSCGLLEARPTAKIPPNSHGHEFWRRVHLLPNGDLLAIFEGFGLIKVDKNSNLIWDFPGKAHHDLHVDRNGMIYLLTRNAHIRPRYNESRPVLEDYISLLTPDGEEIRRVSILKCIENSVYAPLLASMKKQGDILHTNTLELLDGRLADRLPAFREGHILISILYLDLIGVIDLDSEMMVWALTGMWKRQHQPSVLDNGNMLLFDNQGSGNRSRILEFDPRTQQIAWSYQGSPTQPFYSYDCGSCEKLPNGNVLVVESNAGRAFEVTPGQEIVWEYLVPHRAGKDQELIANLFDLVRLDPESTAAWLD